MKRVFFCFIVTLVFMGFSCNDYESMQEKLRKEKKAIEAFIDRNDFVILKNYPADGVFGEKEYYRTSDGLYINVVDSGNGKRVIPYVDEVQVRFEYAINVSEYVSDETSGKYLGTDFSLPKEFIYGNSASFNNDPDGFTCTGWTYPLAHVGEKAIVNLIVPSGLGGSNVNKTFTPIYWKNLQYTTFY